MTRRRVVMTAAAPDFLAGLEWGRTHRADCPECQGRRGSESMGITVGDDGHAVWHCFRCDYSGSWRAHTVTRTGGEVMVLSSPKRHPSLSDYGRDLWHAGRRLDGDALAYLESRACAIPPPDGHLRYLPELKHRSGYVGPALLALVTDVCSNEPISLHRTWIRPDGEKANVDPPRMLLGGHRKDGGIIRLWPDEAVTSGLGVAEGIETALSAALAYQPMWAAIDAGNLAKLPRLPGIEHLLIVADNDPAGREASEACAARWFAAGCRVRITMPPEPGTDLNDIARRSA